MTKARFQHSFSLNEANEARLQALMSKNWLLIDVLLAGLDKIEGMIKKAKDLKSA